MLDHQYDKGDNKYHTLHLASSNVELSPAQEVTAFRGCLDRDASIHLAHRAIYPSSNMGVVVRALLSLVLVLCSGNLALAKLEKNGYHHQVVNVDRAHHLYSSIHTNNPLGSGHAQGMLDSPQAWSARTSNNINTDWYCCLVVLLLTAFGPFGDSTRT
eukprot:2636771-Rhodomonas_salina.1